MEISQLLPQREPLMALLQKLTDYAIASHHLVNLRKAKILASLSNCSLDIARKAFSIVEGG